MPQPNILIVTTDQQRADSLSCYGSGFTETPYLDRLAAQGVRFDRAYCPNPVCTPSRVSLFTGRQVSRHGVWNVGVNCPPDEGMISHRLADVGYRTHYIGKAHFQAFGASRDASQEDVGGWKRGYDGWNAPYYGFETVELALGHATYGISGHYGEWVRRAVGDEQATAWERARNLSSVGFGGNAFDWDIPPEYHNSAWTADRAVAFLRERDSSQPFLLALGFEDPHHPHAVPTALRERVDPERVPLPRFVDGELDDKPPHFLEAREGRLESSAMRGQFHVAGQGGGADYRLVSERDARLGRAYYYSLVRFVDTQFGRVLDELDRLGIADDTLVVFTSDHGELLGDHGLWMKGPFHYEELVRVPMIVRWRNGFDGGSHTDSLMSLVDVVPTCLSAAGLPVPDDLDGVDMLPALRGEAVSTRDDILIEMTDDPSKLRLKTVVTKNCKLTAYAGQSYGELYDLDADPGEQVNRWDDPAYGADKARLLGRIIDYSERIERRQPRLCYA